MSQYDLASLREHHIEVEICRHPFPEFQRMLEKLRVAVHHVVRPHYGCISAHVARADMRALKDGNILNTVIGGEVVSRCQPVTTSADDQHVIAGFRFVRAPSAWPSPVQQSVAA